MAFDLTAYINTQLNLNSAQKLKADIEKNINSIQGKININANVSQLAQLKLQLNQLKQEIKDVSSLSDKLDKSVGKLQPAFSNLNADLNKTNSLAKNSAYVFKDASSALDAFGEQTALAARRFVAFSVSFSAINGFSSLLGDAIKESIAFNREIIRISQVAEDSFSKVRDLSKEVTRLSTSLGVSSSELIKSAVLLKQAGLSTEDTTVAMDALAKAALAPNFDDLASTTNGLIAVMQQFNIKAKDFESVLGSMNSVAGAFAVEAGDLIEVVKKTGGVFASIKGDSKSGRDALNELLALFTSVRATTRESAEQISTGLRTIFGRLQRQETVEALKTLGVQLRYTKKELEESGLSQSLEGQFVGGYEAIRRISQALNQIPSTDPKFAAIVEQIGGLRQLSRVTPLVQQFSEAQRALSIAQSGQASLAINAGQAQEALAVKINKVKEEWLALGRTITEDKGFSEMSDAVVVLSNGLTKLLGNLTPLLPVLATVGAVSGLSFAKKGFNAFTQRSQYPGFKEGFLNNPEAIARMNEASGPGGYSFKPPPASATFKDANRVNSLMVNNPAAYFQEVSKDLVATAKKLNPDYSPQQIGQLVSSVVKKQIREARRANNLNINANTYEKNAEDALKEREKISDDARFYENYRSGKITVTQQTGLRFGQTFNRLSNLGLVQNPTDDINKADLSKYLEKYTTISEIEKLKAAKARTEASSIIERQNLYQETDFLGRKSGLISASGQDLLLQNAKSRPNETGKDTIKGLIQTKTEETIASRKIISEQLKLFTLIKSEETVKQEYIQAVAKQIRALNLVTSAEESLVLAAEMYEKGLINNSVRLQMKGDKIVGDESLGKVSDSDMRKQSVKDAVSKYGQIAQLGLPVISGIIASQFGTATEAIGPNGSGSGTGYAISNAATSAAGYGVGASLMTGNPYLIAGAAIYGFTSSLLDAKKQIAEAKIGIEVQKISDRFRQISEQLIGLDLSSTDEIRQSKMEMKDQSYLSGFFNSPFSTITSPRSLRSEIEDKIRSELSKSTSQSLILLTRELEKNIKSTPIMEGENKQDFSKRVTNNTLYSNNGFFNQELNDIAFVERVSRSKIDQRLKKQVDEMVAAKDFNKSSGDSLRIVNTFDLLAEAVSGATNEVRKFGSTADDIANAINGNFNFVKTSTISDRLKSSSVFDLSTMSMATSSLGGLMGGSGSRFQSQGEAIALTRQALPLILSSIRASGNFGQSGNIQSIVMSQVEDVLKRSGVSDRRIGEIGAAISTGFSQKDLDKLFEEMGSDVSKIAEKLLEPIAKPFADSLVVIRKELEVSTNTYIQQLNSLEASTKKINEIMDSAAGLRRSADLTGAEISSRYSGILPTDSMPMINLLKQSVIRDVGTDNAKTIADRISENFRKLVGAQAAVDNALSNRFAPGGEKAYQETINNFVKLQAETAQLTNALQKLTDASKQLTEIQEKINLLKQEENAAFGMARQKLTSREAERKLERGKEIFEQVKAGRNINDLGRREAGLFFNFVDAAGPRAKAVADAAMRKGGLGLGVNDERELQDLERKKQKIQEDSSKAAEEYAKVIKDQTDFMRNQLMASQERMVAALQKNSETIELQQKLTEQGMVSNQMQEMKPATEAAVKLAGIAKFNFGGIDPKVLEANQNLLSSFASLKEKNDLDDSMAIKVPRKNLLKFAEQNPDSRAAKLRTDISKIVVDSTNKSSDPSVIRNEMESALMEKYKISRPNASAMTPFKITGTNKDVEEIMGNLIDYFKKNPALSEKESKDYYNQFEAIKKIGINPNDIDAGVFKSAAEAIQTIKSHGKTLDSLNEKSESLSKRFKELDESIKNSKIYIDNMKAVEQKKNLIEGAGALMGFGAVEARGFALGGIMNFKPQGRDKIPAMLAPGEAVIPEKLMRSAPIGSLTRMALARNIEGGMPAFAFDRGPFEFGMNTYAAKNKAFNTSSYLTAGPSYVNKPGLSAQRAIEASIIKETAANTLSMARDSYSTGQMRRQGIKVIGMASGGKVPGFGNGDTVPAMLTPGEVILDKRTSEKLGNNALGKVQAFANGGQVLGGGVGQQVNFNDSFEKFGSYINIMVGAFNQFEKNVNLLAEALDKSIKVEGEQNINLNVTGLAGLKTEDTESMKEKILDVVNDRLKQIYPHFV